MNTLKIKLTSVYSSYYVLCLCVYYILSIYLGAILHDNDTTRVLHSFTAAVIVFELYDLLVGHLLRARRPRIGRSREQVVAFQVSDRLHDGVQVLLRGAGHNVGPESNIDMLN